MNEPASEEPEPAPSEIEPPYGVISDSLWEGQVIPFLGAGVNFGNRPKDAKYSDKAAFLPSGAELSHILAGECRFPSIKGDELSDLAKVSSFYVEVSKKRETLRKRLRRIFDRDYPPCAIHTFLAEVTSPLLIVTTNYDDLMERALDAAGRPYDLVVHPTDRKDVGGSVLWWRHGADRPEVTLANKLQIDLERTTVVYKMHGTVDRLRVEGDSYVITEDDYVDFLAGMTSQGKGVVPAIFTKHFRTRQFLFMGYGLRDWNLRVILKNLKRSTAAGRDGEAVSAWAIQHLPSHLERRLWQNRDVDIYNVDINEFAKSLREEYLKRSSEGGA